MALMLQSVLPWTCIRSNSVWMHLQQTGSRSFCFQQSVNRSFDDSFFILYCIDLHSHLYLLWSLQNKASDHRADTPHQAGRSWDWECFTDTVWLSFMSRSDSGVWLPSSGRCLLKQQRHPQQHSSCPWVHVHSQCPLISLCFNVEAEPAAIAAPQIMNPGDFGDLRLFLLVHVCGFNWNISTNI